MDIFEEKYERMTKNELFNYLDKLIIETILSLKAVDLSDEHKKFINTNYEEILVVLNNLKVR